MKRAFITDVHYRMGLAAVRSLGRRSIDITALEYDTFAQESILGFYSRYTSDKRLVPSAAENKSEFINSIISLAAESKRDSNKDADKDTNRDAGKGADAGKDANANAATDKDANTGVDADKGVATGKGADADKGANVSTGGEVDEKPVLIAVGIDTLLAISEHSDLLEPHVSFVAPTLESLEIANDKLRLVEAAAQAGIPCPETTVLSANETIEHLSDRIRYPAVIKYRKGEALKLKPAKRYKIVENREAFIEAYSQMHTMQEFPLVQEYIQGEGFGVSAVFDRNGEPLEIFCHKRLREYPVTGGPSCFCESIWDDRLVDYAIRLLKKLNWRGVAMVEFKGDLDSGAYLMEINPRFWGSLPLSIISGCDIPFAIYRAASGELRNEGGYKCEYKLGARMRFLFQDLLSLPGYMRMRKDKLKFLFQFIGQLLDPRIKDGVLELKDLKPSLAYIRQAIKKL
ncbi:MAG: ATP-grasp domain-containing protein [Clostridiaceae bacterium]|nr:ATP-grasp domain-containing protein [Clostridiaceae bacterium]